MVNPDESSNRLDPSYSKGVLSPGRHVRTRLYFTSESHIHSLLTILRYGGLCGSDDEQWARALDYISRVSDRVAHFAFFEKLIFAITSKILRITTEHKKIKSSSDSKL